MPDADAEKVASALNAELRPLAEIDRNGSGRFTAHPAALGPAMINENAYVIASRNGPLWEAAAAGDLTDEHVDTLTSAELALRRVRDDEIARAQLSETTILSRTLLQFAEHGASNGPTFTPTILWVTEPNSLEDCLHFWNLRALQPLSLATAPMYLIPTNSVHHWLGFADQLARVLERPDHFKPDVLINSLSADKEDLDQIAQELGLELASDTKITSGFGVNRAELRKTPYSYLADADTRSFLDFRPEYGLVTHVDVHVFGGKTTISLSRQCRFLVLEWLWSGSADGHSMAFRAEIRSPTT